MVGQFLDNKRVYELQTRRSAQRSLTRLLPTEHGQDSLVRQTCHAIVCSRDRSDPERKKKLVGGRERGIGLYRDFAA